MPTPKLLKKSSDNDKIEENYQIDIYEIAEDNPHSFDLIINYYDETEAF